MVVKAIHEAESLEETVKLVRLLLLEADVF